MPTQAAFEVARSAPRYLRFVRWKQRKRRGWGGRGLGDRSESLSVFSAQKIIRQTSSCPLSRTAWLEIYNHRPDTHCWPAMQNDKIGCYVNRTQQDSYDPILSPIDHQPVLRFGLESRLWSSLPPWWGRPGSSRCCRLWAPAWRSSPHTPLGERGSWGGLGLAWSTKNMHTRAWTDNKDMQENTHTPTYLLPIIEPAIVLVSNPPPPYCLTFHQLPTHDIDFISKLTSLDEVEGVVCTTVYCISKKRYTLNKNNSFFKSDISRNPN